MSENGSTEAHDLRQVSIHVGLDRPSITIRGDYVVVLYEPRSADNRIFMAVFNYRTGDMQTISTSIEYDVRTLTSMDSLLSSIDIFSLGTTHLGSLPITG